MKCQNFHIYILSHPSISNRGFIVQRTTKIVLVLLLAAALAALLVPAALSQGTDHHGKKGVDWAPDEMYHVVKVTNASGSMVNFDILATAVKGKDGKVISMTATTPKSGTYYFANDTAVIPFGSKTNKTRTKPVKGDYNNATIDVAGGNAVIAMKNVTMTGKGKGDFQVQFTDVGVYLPNGSAKTYKLSAPAKIMGSPDNSSMMIVGNPSLRTAMQDALMGGTTFPAGAKPVMLKTVDGVK
jgi:hypothetical protein